MENTFNDLVLVQLLGYLIAICVGMYQLAMVDLYNKLFYNENYVKVLNILGGNCKCYFYEYRVVYAGNDVPTAHLLLERQ